MFDSKEIALSIATSYFIGDGNDLIFRNKTKWLAKCVLLLEFLSHFIEALRDDMSRILNGILMLSSIQTYIHTYT